MGRRKLVSLYISGLQRVRNSRDDLGSINTDKLITGLFREVGADLGIPRQKEGANGKAFGVFWVPGPLDLMTETRSYAKTAHYYRAKSGSNNCHLFTGYTVTHISFTDELTAYGVSAQPRDSTPPAVIKAIKRSFSLLGSLGLRRFFNGVALARRLCWERLELRLNKVCQARPKLPRPSRSILRI